MARELLTACHKDCKPEVIAYYENGAQSLVSSYPLSAKCFDEHPAFKDHRFLLAVRRLK